VVETAGIRKSVWASTIVVAAALVAVFGATWCLRAARDAGPAPTLAAAPEAREPSARRPTIPAHGARPIPARRPAPAAAAPPPPADPAPSDEPPPHDDPPVGFGPPGSGIALFPPPGSEPLRSGIVVPEDFPLPEGYVRHHQVTDDGQPLPAILMFHPDYDWVDEGGAPVAIPPDRIVPREMAPPGLPIRMLELPDAPGGAERAP
jgi:hypothetical protein